MMEEGASLWAPGSPRLSFSRDFVQSEIFNPSSRKDSCSESPDFEFGMLALLRPDDQPPVVPADELIHNGRLLPVGLSRAQQHPSSQQPALLDQSAIVPEQQQGERKSPKSSGSCSSRWKDFLNFRGSWSSSGSSSSKSSRLRLLFRSSSAGAGRSQESEPALGRSASESNASSSNDLPCSSAAREIIRSRASSVSWDSSSSSASACSIDPRQQQGIRSKPRVPPKASPQKPPGRRALAEVKVGSRSMSQGNYQRVNPSNPNQGIASSNPGAGIAAGPAPIKRIVNHGRSSSSGDAWRAYSEGSRSSSASSSSIKVAEVLHMEVCMGQSLVVSKVAKAFTKKENNNHSNKIGVAG